MFQDNKKIKTLPRMRTVHEAAKELKEMDENTAVTEYHIRQLALSGVLPRTACLVGCVTKGAGW